MGEPFLYDHEYRRRDLHDLFGGQLQGGISTPSKHPMVFLFTGDTGGLYGYRDGQSADGTFHYTGEGQLGDMTFTRGNKAIRDHASEGKTLHLFQKAERRGYVRYLGEMKYVDHQEVEGVPDRDGRPRRAIVFRLAPIVSRSNSPSNQYSPAVMPPSTGGDDGDPG